MGRISWCVFVVFLLFFFGGGGGWVCFGMRRGIDMD